MASFLFLALFVLVAVISASVLKAPVVQKPQEKNYNKILKLLLPKLTEIQIQAEQYLQANGLPFSPSPDYP